MAEEGHEVLGSAVSDNKRALLIAIKEGRIKEIIPKFNYERGFDYCEAIYDFIGGCDGIEEVLESFHDIGILKKEIYESLGVCKNCGSHKLRIKPVCPYCGSPDIDAGTVIEHLSCGFVGLITDFFSKGGRLVCPKCGKELRAIGVDYRKTANMYKCHKCGEFTSLPEMRYICNVCGAELHEKDLLVKKVYKYVVDDEKLSLIDKMLLDVSEIVRKLGERGWIVEAPSRIRGVSGTMLDFTVVLWDPRDRTIPMAAIDIVEGDGEIGEDKILQFFGKSFDANARHWILIAIPKLSDRAREMAKGYGIIVKEVKDPADAASAILDALKQVSEEGSESNITGRPKSLASHIS